MTEANTNPLCKTRAGEARAAPRPSRAGEKRTRATTPRPSRAGDKRTRATTPRLSRAGEKRTRATPRPARAREEKRTRQRGPGKRNRKAESRATPRLPRAGKKRTRQPETSARLEGFSRADQRPTPACPPVQPVQPRREGSRPSSTQQAYFNLADTLVEIRNSASMGGVWQALPSNSKNLLVKLCEGQGVKRGQFMQ